MWIVRHIQLFTAAILFVLLMCYPSTVVAIKKNVTVTWSYNNVTTNTMEYRLYYSYYQDMSNKVLACSINDRNATVITCPNVEFKTNTYFVITAVESGAEFYSADKGVTLPYPVINFIYITE